jgi:pimeloyl-ACP methyl ester carboxylesterase
VGPADAARPGAARAGRVPRARLHRFAHSGHFAQFDEPVEMVRVVLDAIA